jgi:hypothetical protein
MATIYLVKALGLDALTQAQRQSRWSIIEAYGKSRFFKTMTEATLCKLDLENAFATRSYTDVQFEIQLVKDTAPDAH